MIHSTLGFIFTPDLKQVLLIEKQRPKQHKGKLNGLGGKCEIGENGASCLRREVIEEAGLDIKLPQWQKVGNMEWSEWKVEIFAAVFTGQTEKVSSLTTEKVAWYPVNNLPSEVLSNLPWLIPLCTDCLTNPSPAHIEVWY